MIVGFVRVINLIVLLQKSARSYFQWGLLPYGDYSTYLQCRLVDWFLCGVSLCWKVYWKNATSSFKVSMKIPTRFCRQSHTFSIARLWLVFIIQSIAHFYHPLVSICIPVIYIRIINILLTKPLLFGINGLFFIFTLKFLVSL